MATPNSIPAMSLPPQAAKTSRVFRPVWPFAGLFRRLRRRNKPGINGDVRWCVWFLLHTGVGAPETRPLLIDCEHGKSNCKGDGKDHCESDFR